MKKIIILAVSILCVGFPLFFYTDCSAEAAKLPETAETATAGEETAEIDARPDYTIYVNRALNCITVMRQETDGTWEPVKAMVCSCGRQGHKTPEGVFQTSNYYEWRRLVDDTYGKYAVRFNGKILFHSVPYAEPSPDALLWQEYNILGEHASLGCVRLSVEDARWIYDNCKPGTTVVVYSDSETPGLLGKPSAITIAENSPYRGWDPTDADLNNPWLQNTVPQTGTPGIAAPDTSAADSMEPTENTGMIGAIVTIDTFNHINYADRYPDLKAAFGYDKIALYRHYITYGIAEGRTAS